MSSSSSFDAYKREAAALERQLEDQIARASSGNDGLSRAELGESGSSAVQQQQWNDVLQKMRLSAVTPSQRAVVTRYEQVYRELRGDYERAQRQQQRQAERHELLSAGRNGNNGVSPHDPALDALLRERNSIQNSVHQAGSILGQAEAIRADLHGQGRSLRNTHSTMGRIMAQVPSLNTVMDAIRRRRSADDKVVAVFIALCVCFTLWYLFG
jgi:golgi SNAP receptor complex member 1